MIGVFLAQRVPFVGHRRPRKLCEPIEIIDFLRGLPGICLAKLRDVMVYARKTNLVALMIILSACGANQAPRPILNASSPVQETRIVFESLPMIQLAYNRSSDNQSVIVPVNRTIQMHEYEQLVEPQLTLDQAEVLSFVTGVGIEAGIDTLNENGEQVVQPLPIRMAIRAREWDPVAMAFKPQTKLFTQQGISLDGSQEFAILEAYDPNYLFTGLGLRLREGRFTKLQLQRKTLSSIYDGGGFMNASTSIVLPPGWAMVGLIIAIDRASPTLPTRDPFVEDIAVFTGHLTRK